MTVQYKVMHMTAERVKPLFEYNSIYIRDCHTKEKWYKIESSLKLIYTNFVYILFNATVSCFLFALKKYFLQLIQLIS